MSCMMPNHDKIEMLYQNLKNTDWSRVLMTQDTKIIII